MKPLLIDTAFPRLQYDNRAARARIWATGTLPDTDGVAPAQALEWQALYVLYLSTEGDRAGEAPAVIDTLVFDHRWADILPPLMASWLWTTRMTLFIAGGDNMSQMSTFLSGDKQNSTQNKDFSFLNRSAVI